jgi:CRP-like cAMP-binding protein
LASLPDDHRDRRMALAQDVEFPAGRRIFEEKSKADRFWIIRDGDVSLELHVPGCPPAPVEKLGQGSLLGWSWLFPPRRWHMSARAPTGVRAFEFDAAEVPRLCQEHPDFGHVFVLTSAAEPAEEPRANGSDR